MIVWCLDSMPITANVVRYISFDGEVFSIQHYMIKFVSNLWQVGVFSESTKNLVL
jgi:hypothetical protein